MSYTVKTYKPCSVCGAMTNRRRNDTREPSCLECNIDRANAAALQMVERSGPIYEKWRKSMMRTFAQQSTG